SPASAWKPPTRCRCAPRVPAPTTWTTDLMPNTHRQPGPDFLDSVADQNAASGLETNAAEFRQRAKDWRTDQQRIDTLEAQVARLERQLRTADDQVRVLDEIKQTLQAANDLPHNPAASAA